MISFQENQVFIEQIQEFLIHFTDFEIRSVNSLFGYCNRYKEVFVSQSTIAKKIGCSRQLVNKIFGIMAQFGLIKKHFRRWTTCIYELPDFFWDILFRKQLSHILTALNYFPSWKLLSRGADIKNIYINTEEFAHRGSQGTTNFKEFWHEWRADEFKQLNQPNTTIFLNTKQQKASLLEPPKQHVSQEMPRSSLLFVKKKEAVMKIVPDYIQNITELPLSHANKIELSVYSKDVIDYARLFLAKQTTLSNPTAWFLAVCKKHNQKMLDTMTKNKQQQPSVPREWQQQTEFDREYYMYKKHQMEEYILRVSGKNQSPENERM